MSECRECERSIPESANFCPSCGAPQNEEAARALESFTKQRLQEMSPAEREDLMHDESIPSRDSSLSDRLSYALGWLTVVAGLAILPSIASGFVLFAGIVVLPPVRRLLDRTVGTQPGLVPMVALYTLSVSLGGVFFWIL